MHNFIAVHHGKHSTNFTHAESIEEARAYLISLVTTQFSRPGDTMAIVSVHDSSPIYYQTGQNTVASLTGEPTLRRSDSVWKSIHALAYAFRKGLWFGKMAGLKPL